MTAAAIDEVTVRAVWGGLWLREPRLRTLLPLRD